MRVTSIRPQRWERDGQSVTTWWVALEGRDAELPCYDARAASDLQVGAALPVGWTVRTSQRGKEYLAPPPAQGDGGRRTAAWRQSREALAAEQERMDRRTALMQAVAALGIEGGAGEVLRTAEQFYAWLRETVRETVGVAAAADDVAGSSLPPPATPTPRPGPIATGEQRRAPASPEAVGAGGGEAPAPPAEGTCVSCGAAWGPMRTASGRRICLRGHVERS